jgi:hypothetical protein
MSNWVIMDVRGCCNATVLRRLRDELYCANDTATAVDQLRSRLQARQQGEAASVAVTLICSCADIRAASDSKDLLEETTMVLRSLRDPELTNPMQLTSTKDQ